MSEGRSQFAIEAGFRGTSFRLFLWADGEGVRYNSWNSDKILLSVIFLSRIMIILLNVFSYYQMQPACNIL